MQHHIGTRAYLLLLTLAVITLPLAACTSSQSNATSPPIAPVDTATSAPSGDTYTDAKLGFRLTVPPGWTAISYSGIHGSPQSTDLVFADKSRAAHRIEVGVIHSTTMPAAFAARGTAPSRVGPYPAFVADTTLQQGRVPCLVRIFLAGDDYVIGEWCAMDAFSHETELERVLATYQPTATVLPTSVASNGSSSPSPTCSQVQIAFGYKNNLDWGRTLAQAGATAPLGGWRTLDPGVAICSNTSSPDQYLFQCTELVNRFDAAERGLPHLPGNAARYADYYQEGTLHLGVIRDLPAGTYAFSDDASQGNSAFAPAPGDLLIFQDVANPHVGWTSGLIHSPGHVAIITGIDATHVYIAQENFNDKRAFMALPLQHSARGYAITDLSGLPNRIVRGWIRFTLT
jgi:CHAP domain